MTVNKLGENRVLIILGEQDMNDFSLDFNNMNLDDSHSRHVLTRLTHSACKSSGIDTGGKSLNIEALSLGDGCYLLVTVGSSNKTYRRKRGGSVCYSLGGSGNLLNCIEQLYRLGTACSKSSVYEYSGEYFLVFDYPSVPKSVRVVLSEFSARRCRTLTLARLRERARLICDRNAVCKIGQYLV